MLKGPISILEQDNTISELVGNNKADTKTKIYPVFCPQPEKHPYCIVRQTGKARAGKGNCAWLCTFDVYSYAENYDDVEAIDLAVVACFEASSPGTYNNVVMGSVTHENTVDQHVDKPALYVKVSSFSTYVNE